MNVQSGDGGSIRRYLLGELSEQEREPIEQRLMSDDDFYEQFLLAEGDLIDAYISGALSEQEQAQFGRHFLQVPELRQEVRATTALRKYAQETAPPVADTGSTARSNVSFFNRWMGFFRRPVVGVSFAAALLTASILLASWLAIQNLRLREQVEQLQAQRVVAPVPQNDLAEQLAAERLRGEQLSTELRRQQELLSEESRKLQTAQAQAHPTPARPPGQRASGVAFFAFTLTSGATRDSGGLKKISIPRGRSEVRIRLDIASDDYRRYRAVLQTDEGQEVLSTAGLQAVGGRFVPLKVKSEVLKPGEYRIQLLGVSASGESEEISNYYFRILP